MCIPPAAVPAPLTLPELCEGRETGERSWQQRTAKASPCCCGREDKTHCRGSAHSVRFAFAVSEWEAARCVELRLLCETCPLSRDTFPGCGNHPTPLWWYLHCYMRSPSHSLFCIRALPSLGKSQKIVLEQQEYRVVPGSVIVLSG